MESSHRDTMVVYVTQRQRKTANKQEHLNKMQVNNLWCHNVTENVHKY